MALVVIDPTAVVEFTVEPEGTEDPTIFLISALDPFTHAYINDRATITKVETKELTVNLGLRNVLLAQFGLRGWRNLRAKNGGEVAFSSEVVNTPAGTRTVAAISSMDHLPLLAVAKIADEVVKLSSIEGEQEKN